jgi:hypothetical protein
VQHDAIEAVAHAREGLLEHATAAEDRDRLVGRHGTLRL